MQRKKNSEHIRAPWYTIRDIFFRSTTATITILGCRVRTSVRKARGEDTRYTNHGYGHEKRNAREELEQFKALDRHLPEDEAMLVEQQSNTAYEWAT